jgi:hypothetical protein
MPKAARVIHRGTRDCPVGNGGSTIRGARAWRDVYWRLYFPGVLETITISSIDADGKTTTDMAEVPRRTEFVRSTDSTTASESYAARKISISTSRVCGGFVTFPDAERI